MTRKHQDKPTRRYGVMYWFDGRRTTHPNAWGTCEKLINACGNAAKHVSRSEFDGSEYRRAAVWDRWTQQIIRIYSQTADGISIVRYTARGERIEGQVKPGANVVRMRA